MCKIWYPLQWWAINLIYSRFRPQKIEWDWQTWIFKNSLYFDKKHLSQGNGVMPIMVSKRQFTTLQTKK